MTPASTGHEATATDLPVNDPPMSGVSRALTSRAGAWLALAVTVLLAAGVLGTLGGSEAPGGATSLPSGSASATVQQLQQEFPDADEAPVIAVLSRSDGAALTGSDRTAVGAVASAMGDVAGEPASDPVVSDDGRAAITSVPASTAGGQDATDRMVTELREAAQQRVPEDLTVQITGGPAFGVDIAAAFDGANVTLLAITVAVVALLLLLTYRSPVLWLVPLAVVAAAERVAAAVTAWMGQTWELSFDAGIISVLVFGAGTNYALLLVSRYREQLRRRGDHREAMAVARQATLPAILASNVTVVLALLTLVFAVTPSTRGLGIAAAAGLVIAAVFVLLVLPAALAVCGRGVFWPFIPRSGAQPDGGGVWLRVARRVTRRPAPVLTVSLVVLAVFAAGLLGTRVGLSQTEQFRVESESAQGLQTLAEHFPPGQAAPMTVLSRTAQAERVAAVAKHAPGVVRAMPVAESDTGWSEIRVVGSADPGTEAARQEVRDVRAAVGGVPGARALVGGADAEALDQEQAAQRDLLTVAPLILALVLLILVGLLRAVLAPVLLVLVNLVSAVAAIGLGTWVGTHLFGFPALDVNVPLLAFLFLVALGIDYTIFLVHRAHQLTASVDTREAITQAIGRTGAVITSAGVVLASVFAALGVLPLVVLGQLGLIVGLGVLVDTTVVRTLVVPALFALVGDRIWWPRPRTRQ